MLFNLTDKLLDKHNQRFSDMLHEEAEWLVGSILRVTTLFNEIIDGEVYSFDPVTASIVLRKCARAASSAITAMQESRRRSAWPTMESSALFARPSSRTAIVSRSSPRHCPSHRSLMLRA